jgi:hypothetical protein
MRRERRDGMGLGKEEGKRRRRKNEGIGKEGS